MKIEKLADRSIRPDIKEDLYKVNKERQLSTIDISSDDEILLNGGLGKVGTR